MQSQCSRTGLISQQVLDYKEHREKVCQVWKNKPHNSNHWPGGKNPNKKGKGQKSKKSDSSGKKKVDKKAKGKEKAQTSANVLTVPELAEFVETEYCEMLF